MDMTGRSYSDRHTPGRTEDSLALEAFEALAEWFAARAPRKPHNAFYDRPAVLSLLPPVKGMRVFDAGCGPGIYTEWLVHHGAEVVACDVSPSMIRLAEARLAGAARFLVADIALPLEFLDSESFDLIVSALVLDYVRDWPNVFREFHRVLRPGGHLVFSVAHPGDEFYEHHRSGNYFEVERVEYKWTGFGTPVVVPSYRRPLSAMLNPLVDAGLLLEHVLEPRPVAEFEDHDPKDFAKLMRQPGFICFRARKPEPNRDSRIFE
jgi:SAM-dependent methyltransferase